MKERQKNTVTKLTHLLEYIVVLFQPLLQEYQSLQRKRLKAAVGAVLAANRLHKLLLAGRQDRRDEAASYDGDHQSEVKEEDTVTPQDEAEMNSQDSEKMPCPHQEEDSRVSPCPSV